MKLKKLIIPLLLLGLVCLSCSTEKDYNPSPRANFDALWHELDVGYCYFQEKLPADSTWEMMHQKYLPRISEGMSSYELFDVLSALMMELKDGHVTLYSSFDTKAYDEWRASYPRNVDRQVRFRYLGSAYRIARSLVYAPIEYNEHQKDSVGLIYYSSFSNDVGHNNVNAVLQSFHNCRGVIIDIRDNGGGSLSNAFTLASHFAEKETIVGYTSYKTGPGHCEFSSPKSTILKPTKYGIHWKKPVVILTNRGVYSAANDFSLFMKQLPQVTLLGDTTGGGGGLPRGSELPNGWRLRYSGSKTTDPEGNQVEFGIPPDIKVSLKESDIEKGKDTLIEEAIKVIVEKSKSTP